MKSGYGFRTIIGAIALTVIWFAAQRPTCMTSTITHSKAAQETTSESTLLAREATCTEKAIIV